jgi:hypothetical protein
MIVHAGQQQASYRANSPVGGKNERSKQTLPNVLRETEALCEVPATKGAREESAHQGLVPEESQGQDQAVSIGVSGDNLFHDISLEQICQSRLKLRFDKD